MIGPASNCKNVDMQFTEFLSLLNYRIKKKKMNIRREVQRDCSSSQILDPIILKKIKIGSRGFWKGELEGGASFITFFHLRLGMVFSGLLDVSHRARRRDDHSSGKKDARAFLRSRVLEPEEAVLSISFLHE